MNVSRRVVDEKPGMCPSGEFVAFSGLPVGKADPRSESKAILCFMLIQPMKTRAKGIVGALHVAEEPYPLKNSKVGINTQ
jgi:hypothetical protein